MNNYLRKYRERRYFMRIVLSINVLLVFFVLASLMTAFWYSQRISLDSQREANVKVLSQINYNISYMNETVKNFAVSLFYDNDMAHLLYSGEVDRFEDTTRVNKLNKTIAYNTFLHSVAIYNSKRGVYFTGGDSAIDAPNSELLDRLDGYLSGEEPIYKMQLMPVRFHPDIRYPERMQDVFSLFLFDSLADYARTESALILNVKPEWLLEKLELMNGRPADRANQLFVLDQNMDVYASSVRSNLDLEALKSEVQRRYVADGNEVAQFTFESGGEKHIVNYMANPSVQWIVVGVEPYDVVLAAVYKLRLVFLTVAAVCLVLAILASLFVTNKLYSPIDGLLKQTKRLPGNETNPIEEKDEISYIAQMYNRLVDTFMQKQVMLEGDESILRSYYVRKLITASSSFSEEDKQECVDRGYLRSSLSRELVLGVLRLDDFAKLKERATDSEVNLLHFAIANIIQEVVSEERNGDVVDMRDDQLVLLLEAGADAEGEDRYATIAQLLRRAQSIVNDYYHVTFTVAFSEPTDDFRKLTARYERALDILAYKMIFGICTVITPPMIRANQDNPETNIPPELERKFIEAVKSNRQESVYQELEQLRRVIGEMSIDAVVQSIIHLGIILKQTVREINQNKLAPLSIDLRSVDRLVFEKETLDDIFGEFRGMLDAIFVDQKRGVENKDLVIVDTIKDIIQANYVNPNLGLQDISDRMKMSSAYVGRIFKRHETISVADYINEIRLTKSVLLLENHNLPVNEISEKVGFSSPSYFFKLFKKRFGTTPKDYRIKKSLTVRPSGSE